MSKSLTDFDAPIDFSTVHTCRECKQCGDYRRKELRAKVLEEAAKVAERCIRNNPNDALDAGVTIASSMIADAIRKLANEKGE